MRISGLFFLAAFLLVGCGSVRDAREQAVRIGQGGGMVARRIPAGIFQLSAWEKLLDPTKSLHVYIEGDGLSWVTRTEPAMDPTPRNPVALHLAAADRWPNVLYLARPCQFTPHEEDVSCDARWWTSHRSAEEVVAAMNAAISKVVHEGQTVRLFGYSGGGGVAALVAARRTDVEALVTVAGNLDHQRLNAIHHVSQTPQSLNPIEVTPRLAHVPQIHFVGGSDQVVPAEIAQEWKNTSKSGCVQMVVVPDASHDAGWKNAWGWMQKMIPSCAP
ncbi:MAG TPA: alpha/beta hydrolase [Rhodospirillaceae bacterium]|nr:MAG: hypothetical protein A2018_02255 [Alphaproteobacteria bacterium GWF2_58_20]HAU29530.1 alpha/beta hydrolase [Rhodospirillaceae bacterium]